MFNQTLSTTTTTCMLESTTGAFCADAVTTTETTLNYLNFLFYLLIPIIPFMVIGFFRRKK